jgi:TolB-like protein/class 3 adenylate cyclase/Flp pilus assembly protein TadD
MRESPSRRLAAILAADIAGYSALMGDDEARTVHDLKGHQAVVLPMVGEFEGRIIDTAGDGILAEFPSVVNAVKCAVAIQAKMAERNATTAPPQRLQFRIGINFGDVLYDEARIYGDGINVAARLENIAEPGGICISSKVYEEISGRLDLPYQDIGDQQLKNIARPVRVYRVRLDTSPARPTLGLPGKPSIAVLPFTNMSGDTDQEYFADGISEDIITALSKLRWLFVIARNSSFTYKGQAIDLKRVSRELGVRYILEGSVRKVGNRVRITTQLIDATTGSHLWADRHDGDLADIFSLQDEITGRVVAAIEPRLLEAEGSRSQSRSPEDLNAWDMIIQANFLFWRLTKLDGQAAIAILRQAVQRHPEYAPAHSTLAFALLFSRQIGWISMEPQVKEPAALATRAAELDDSDPWAHLALGYVAYTRRRTEEAVEEFQRALDLNPNFAAAYGYLGCALAMDGQSDRAIENITQALRMSPHDPQNAMFNAHLAAAHYLAGRYTEAVGFSRKALQQRSGLTNAHRIYIASLAQAGQLDDARTALSRLQELQPENSISWIERTIPYTPVPMAKFLEGMRKAGLQ